MSHEVDPEQMLEKVETIREQTTELMTNLWQLKAKIKQLAWVVSTQDEDLFSLLLKLADVKDNMSKYHTELPPDQAKLEHTNRDAAHQKYWSDLCNEDRRLTNKLAIIGRQFREAKEP
jgi:hypothetical protein